MPRKPILILFQRIHKQKQRSPKKPDIIKRSYSNHMACKHCNKQNKYISTSTTHKTITKYGSELKKTMMLKWKKPEKQKNTIKYHV